MRFNSLEYVLFLAAYLVLVRIVPARANTLLIIAASLVFYAWWDPLLAWVPLVLCSMAYLGVHWQSVAATPTAQRARMLTVVATLFVPLAIFKYEDFFYNDIVAPVLDAPIHDLRWVLPLGISFITFTMVAYVVDVYRGKFPREASFPRLLAFTLYFPQLIAGPILRPAQLLPQLGRSNQRRLASLGLGLTIFTVGLVKKVVFADSIGGVVDTAFAAPGELDLLTCWLAILGFTVQIYCDFSGYTDMAIGSAVMLGVRLPTNFDRPYAVLSLRDFWRRWHITLSNWLRDYLYIPLGGNRRTVPRHLANIVITMVLGGLWHGANWTLIAWGGVHGVGLALVHLVGMWPAGARACRLVPAPARWALTFLFVALAWTLFRAPDVATAVTIVTGAATAPLGSVIAFGRANAFVLALLVIFAALHRFDSLRNVRFAYRKANRGVLFVIVGAVWALAIAASTGSSRDFIYFDF